MKDTQNTCDCKKKIQALYIRHHEYINQIRSDHRRELATALAEQHLELMQAHQDEMEKSEHVHRMQLLKEAGDQAKAIAQLKAQHEIELASLGKKMESAEKASKDKIERYKKALAVEIARGG